MNLQQMVNQNPLQNYSPIGGNNPYLGLESMPNVQIIRGTPKPTTTTSTTPTPIANTIPTEPSVKLSNLLEIKMNKCCPLNFHYSEDKFGRMKCVKQNSEINRIVAKSKVFKTVKQYSCEASMGQYIDDFLQLDLNGDGFVKYKTEVFEKYCMDYHAKMGKFIILRCKGKDRPEQESRVLGILKQRAQKLNDIEPSVKKPQLKTKPTTTTLPPFDSEEYSYEDVKEEVEKAKPTIPEIKSRSEIKKSEIKTTTAKAESEDYEIEYEYEDVEE